MRDGYLEVLRAVLRAAYQDLAGPPPGERTPARTRKYARDSNILGNRQRYRAAHWWFFEDASTDAFSLVEICLALDKSVDRARDVALEIVRRRTEIEDARRRGRLTETKARRALVALRNEYVPGADTRRHKGLPAMRAGQTQPVMAG